MCCHSIKSQQARLASISHDGKNEETTLRIIIKVNLRLISIFTCKILLLLSEQPENLFYALKIWRKRAISVK